MSDVHNPESDYCTNILMNLGLTYCLPPSVDTIPMSGTIFVTCDCFGQFKNPFEGEIMLRFATLLSGSLTLLFTCGAMMQQPDPPVGQTIGVICKQNESCHGWKWKGDRPSGCSVNCVGNCTYCAAGGMPVNVCRETNNPLNTCAGNTGTSQPACALMYNPPCQQLPEGCSCQTNWWDYKVMKDGVHQQCRWDCT